MYLNDLARDVINKKLEETCLGRTIRFNDYDDSNIEKEVVCMSIKMEDDDGDTWIVLKDDKGTAYTIYGQGLDIFFEIV